MCIANRIYPLIGAVVFLLCHCHSAHALQLSLGNQDAEQGQSVAVNIVVGDYTQENIAGAAFTVAYNENYFSLTGVTSDFFDTFLGQWQSLEPIPDPTPPADVMVDGQVYSQPLLFSTVINDGGKVLLGGARVQAGTPSVLMTLHFAVDATTPPGIYPVSIFPTAITNTGAGYGNGGEVAPILVGIAEGETDPALSYPTYSPTIVNGTISVQATFIDSDNDGIDDHWEILHFGNLMTTDQNSDFDQDGYTDLQEYLNKLADENDPMGNPYDPKTKNASAGTGYNPTAGNGIFWQMMLPAILSGSQGLD